MRISTSEPRPLRLHLRAEPQHFLLSLKGALRASFLKKLFFLMGLVAGWCILLGFAGELTQIQMKVKSLN